MRFGVLGPLEVWSGTGEVVPVGGPRARAMVVQLALSAGRVVPVEQLIAGVYGDQPPAGAGNALQAQVSRLRRSLPAEVVEFDRHGYRLAVPPDAVDAFRFERLAADGHRLLTTERFAEAADVLREALGLCVERLTCRPGSPRRCGWKISGWRSPRT
jgi:DNA-binding SARP family transcriptional activator